MIDSDQRVNIDKFIKDRWVTIWTRYDIVLQYDRFGFFITWWKYSDVQYVFFFKDVLRYENPNLDLKSLRNHKRNKHTRRKPNIIWFDWPNSTYIHEEKWDLLYKNNVTRRYQNISLPIPHYNSSLYDIHSPYISYTQEIYIYNILYLYIYCYKH